MRVFNRSFVSIDGESNGLHGPVFSVGAVLKRPGCYDSIFYARCPIVGKVDDWVERNVLPSLDARGKEMGLYHTHDDARSMRDDFWRWLVMGSLATGSAVDVYADCPWPVEAGLLSACVADDPSRKGPYPLYDVATLLMAARLDPLEREAASVLTPRELATYRKHDPVWDAIVSARFVDIAMNAICRRDGGR